MSLKDLGNKSSSLIKHKGTNIEGSNKKGRLNILINIMETSDIWGTITNNKLGLQSLEFLKHLVKGRFLGNITLDMADILNRGNVLEIDSDSSDLIMLRLSESFFKELLGDELRPRSW
eukprot:CAMPEP_0114593878 /NCGR_PEP_ID=MMETSP0125-20121206/15469_1 /TAXON_ID=485358 ORGANISM="Aristerostoma sp., Strain ATCC 50986" /NCGR_SAMPLE_ID=MMETSP0125 /ASSEMBLY_ACC=CAM_ASM_000245 /LENGTH=117 /DNA_ID=CAMNT_0001793491 /DNA_START=242 /DNA_END=592 /DNA_ORIENTATION=-